MIAFQLGALASVLVIDALYAANRRHVSELTRLARTDGLTALYNKRSFDERFREELARAARHQEPISLLITDIDRFKGLNDSRGHAHGDEVLMAFSREIERVCRAEDIAFRLGGDEFAILMPRTSADGALELAARLEAAVSRANDLGADPVMPVTISAGLSSWPTPAWNPEELRLQADEALYQVKQGGRNSHGLFSDAFAAMMDGEFGLDPEIVENARTLLWGVAEKDRYTYGHSERVSRYTGEIASALGLPSDTVTSLRFAGLLHDVGKIAIAPAILLKSTDLTRAEQAIVMCHPVEGAKIAESVDHDGSLARIIAHHHERYDGTGYPDRLSGEDIPYGARILAVADAYDALTSERPYRDSMAVEDALKQLELGAGTQFDPAVVAGARRVFGPDLVRSSSGAG